MRMAACTRWCSRLDIPWQSHYLELHRRILKACQRRLRSCWREKLYNLPKQCSIVIQTWWLVITTPMENF
ncbi:hypothetical protein B7P43_G17385 [Cryptotermes secundus]|uniref:Uncharacterized protein n=1 Tax=Cryptotermes secundus TaxID=105785 RepID=A0A2J7QE09_9NEOP|nr:hypothetical protein B7P43_G17385 [Cryptotermes secundus]